MCYILVVVVYIDVKGAIMGMRYRYDFGCCRYFVLMLVFVYERALL